jgi:hypothetical protein
LGSHVECLHLNRMLRGTFTGKEYQLLTRSWEHSFVGQGIVKEQRNMNEE